MHVLFSFHKNSHQVYKKRHSFFPHLFDGKINMCYSRIETLKELSNGTIICVIIEDHKQFRKIIVNSIVNSSDIGIRVLQDKNVIHKQILNIL